MQWHDDCPVTEEEFDARWRAFARRWAELRVTRGPSTPADDVAFDMFDTHDAVWILNRGEWQLDEELIEARDAYELEFLERERALLEDSDRVKIILVRNMLSIVQSTTHEAKDRVAATAQLMKLYGLEQKPLEGEEGGLGRIGTILIQTPTVDDFEKEAFRQQSELQETAGRALADMETATQKQKEVKRK